MRGKVRTTWKVRPMPARQMRFGFSPVMSRPANRTLPPLGAASPFSRLNSVVLPAPLGPMMPRISPSSTSKLTSWTAFSPP